MLRTQQVVFSLRFIHQDSPFSGMSVQDLLQKDVKQVVGPNIRLLISSLPSEYTVEVKEKNITIDESSP